MPYSESILSSIRAIKRKSGKRLRVVAEYDDDIFNVSPWNEKYNVFGVKDISVTYKTKRDIDKINQALELSNQNKWTRKHENPDGSMTYDMWRAGFGDFNPEVNLVKQKAAKSIIEEVDLLTVTTPQLAVQLRKYRPIGKIAVLPNLVDYERFLPMKEPEKGTFTIGWQGGSAHFADLAMWKEPLIEFAKKYPDVRYRFMGVGFQSVFNEINERVVWLPWHGDINTYPLHVRDLKCHVALAPVVDDGFNRGKSPIKWEEMAAMRVPVIASNVICYKDFIEHGKDGYIARPDEVFQYLEELRDPIRREAMAQIAYQRVYKRFSLQENATMYWSALQDLVFGPSIKSADNIRKFKPIELEIGVN
jgi:glycosyltransferase involved in cell wall biosynthesis